MLLHFIDFFFQFDLAEFITNQICVFVGRCYTVLKVGRQIQAFKNKYYCDKTDVSKTDTLCSSTCTKNAVLEKKSKQNKQTQTKKNLLNL